MSGLNPLNNNADQYLAWMFSQNPVARFSPVFLPLQFNNQQTYPAMISPVMVNSANNGMQSNAIQNLKLIQQYAQASPEFCFNESSYLSILSDSGVLTKEISEMIDKILINKTETVTEIINGISNLDLATLSESEIEEKVQMYNNLLSKAKSQMAVYRSILMQAVEKVKAANGSGSNCNAEIIRNELINNLNQNFAF